MKFIYQVFDLLVRTNHPIPQLAPIEHRGFAVDVEVHLGLSPGVDCGDSTRDIQTYTSLELDAQNRPALQIWENRESGLLRLEYCDGNTFWLNRQGSSIWAQWLDSQTLADAATYLFGPVLGLLLRLRGVNCLHSSAVVIGDGAVAFVGAAGSGKSTTAAALARRGCAVISDDIVAIQESKGVLHVLPAYPFICLMPSSVEMLEGAGGALPAFTPNWDKLCFSLAQPGLRFEQQSQPFRAIYLLDDSPAETPLQVRPVSPREALVELVTNSYATRALDGRAHASEFPALARLVSSVPVRRIVGHLQARNLDHLCQLIVENLQDRRLEMSA